jgi:serine protease
MSPSQRSGSSSYTWTAASGSVIPGHSYTLALTSHDDNYSGDPTYTLFDDIKVS